MNLNYVVKEAELKAIQYTGDNFLDVKNFIHTELNPNYDVSEDDYKNLKGQYIVKMNKLDYVPCIPAHFFNFFYKLNEKEVLI